MGEVRADEATAWSGRQRVVGAQGKLSRTFELIRRGGATNLANDGDSTIIARAAKHTTDCIARGGKAQKSQDQKEAALQGFECWLLYMFGSASAAGKRMEELDRFLFSPAR